MYEEYVCVNTFNGALEGVVLMNSKQAKDANLELLWNGEPQRWVPVNDEDAETFDVYAA